MNTQLSIHTLNGSPDSPVIFPWDITTYAGIEIVGAGFVYTIDTTNFRPNTIYRFINGAGAANPVNIFLPTSATMNTVLGNPAVGYSFSITLRHNASAIGSNQTTINFNGVTSMRGLTQNTAFNNNTAVRIDYVKHNNVNWLVSSNGLNN